jgi:hypothetical protein
MIDVRPPLPPRHSWNRQGLDGVGAAPLLHMRPTSRNDDRQ